MVQDLGAGKRRTRITVILEVVQNSCNPGFVELGDRLGKDKLFSYIKNFGFGQKQESIFKGKGEAFCSRWTELAL